MSILTKTEQKALFDSFSTNKPFKLSAYTVHSQRLFYENKLLISSICLDEHKAFLFSPSSTSRLLIEFFRSSLRSAEPNAIFIWSNEHSFTRQEQIEQAIHLQIRFILKESYQLFRSHAEQQTLKHLSLLEALSALSFIFRFALAPTRIWAEDIRLQNNLRYLERQKTLLEKTLKTINKGGSK